MMMMDDDVLNDVEDQVDVTKLSSLPHKPAPGKMDWPWQGASLTKLEHVKSPWRE